jgi:hypothetical protein
MRRNDWPCRSTICRQEPRSWFGSARTNPPYARIPPSVIAIQSSRPNFYRFLKENRAAGKRWHSSTALLSIRIARWRSILPTGVHDARRDCDHLLPKSRQYFCDRTGGISRVPPQTRCVLLLSGSDLDQGHHNHHRKDDEYAGVHGSLRSGWKSNGELVSVWNHFVFLCFVSRRNGLQIHFLLQFLSGDDELKMSGRVRML